MSRVVVSEFVTIDGVFEDPGGAEGAGSQTAGETLILTFVPRGVG